MVHENSIETHRELKKTGEVKRREDEIQECYLAHGPLTDRQVLQILKPGSDDLNYVRPRITEMIRPKKPGKPKLLQEVDTTIDPVTKKPVRIVDFLMHEPDQINMFGG